MMRPWADVESEVTAMKRSFVIGMLAYWFSLPLSVAAAQQKIVAIRTDRFDFGIVQSDVRYHAVKGFTV